MTKAKDCDFCWSREMIRLKFPGVSREFDREIAVKDDWYAVLAREQYTLGHSLVICRSKDDQKEEEECKFNVGFLSRNPKRHSEAWQNLAAGMGQVALALQEELESLQGLEEWEEKWGKVRKAESIHILALCEGIPHLHAHLIPRYEYRNWEKEFYRAHYFERERRQAVSELCFEERLEEGQIHGMWYAACREMNYDQTCFGLMSSEDRGKRIENLAACIRKSSHLL